ncbi:hypothetical protein, variant [Aphanomyces astaci]|uniref:Uncharacterized protein n=1 Tax=Aphanomyces astaci TaxID=112090 RepID=W4GRJ8_APHAT|nr:hypothetical protein, variant [Aphanomyces astaci]ETV81961.1 hypothetical protein, variant [Aphanomyces astaci]|eukprot:XP_009828698.1 hypothetical protein, variant [Aphanomyces astaci]
MLEWSRDRRRGHEQRLRHGASTTRHEDRRRQVAASYYPHHNHTYEDDDEGTPRVRSHHPPKRVVSNLAAFHEDEYVDYLKERRDMRASQPHDRGKWKCMGTEFVDGAEHASALHIAVVPPDAAYSIERQFWTWCGREVSLEKLVVDAPPSLDDLSLHDAVVEATTWTPDDVVRSTSNPPSSSSDPSLPAPSLDPVQDKMAANDDDTPAAASIIMDPPPATTHTVH